MWIETSKRSPVELSSVVDCIRTDIVTDFVGATVEFVLTEANPNRLFQSSLEPNRTLISIAYLFQLTIIYIDKMLLWETADFSAVQSVSSSQHEL